MTDICALSATDIATAVRARKLSATEVAEAHLTRIASANPAINAIVQEFPEEARAAAAEVDARLAAGEDPGPLAGVPVTTKVNVDQKGHATTNGLTLQKDLIAQADNPVVANLRKAGAVIVGRTNTPAFSLRWFTDNDLHGQTLNPRDPGLTPGGSSGGAGAAVAAGLCAVGHGTDIAGSVRYPAYACGLHGLRPTPGRIPAWNPSAPDRYIGAQLMAVSGPLARSVDDIELAFHAMAAGHVDDPWWMPVPLEPRPFTRRVALSLAPDGMKVAEEIAAELHAAAGALDKAGWIVEEVDPPSMRAAADLNARLWMAEMHQGATEALVREGNEAANFVYEQMTAGMAPPDLANTMAALRDRVTLIRDWQRFLDRVPLILCPNSGTLPFAQGADTTSAASFAQVYEAQLPQRAVPTLGLPALSVATGFAGRAPVGVQLIAGRFREDILLEAARVIEAACGTPQICDPASA